MTSAATKLPNSQGAAMSYAEVSEQQIFKAMHFFEKKHIATFGPLDGVNLPAEVSNLADLLGALWFAKQTIARVNIGSRVAALLAEAGQTLKPV